MINIGLFLIDYKHNNLYYLEKAYQKPIKNKKNLHKNVKIDIIECFNSNSAILSQDQHNRVEKSGFNHLLSRLLRNKS